MVLWAQPKQDRRPLRARHIPANPWLESGYLLALPVEGYWRSRSKSSGSRN
jgi:hypothetical protein